MNFATIILAAGHGTRMQSELPKPLHRLGGKPLLGWVMDSTHAAGANRHVVVVSKDSDDISTFISSYENTRGIKAEATIQNPVQGTGHAVEQARDALSDYKGIVVVAYADTPLIYADTYHALAAALNADANASVACLGFDNSNPAGYGRMVTDDNGHLLKIVEEKDASKAEKAITFVNAGTMALRAPMVFDLLDAIDNSAKTGEKYLTDCIAAARTTGQHVITIHAHVDEVMGINTRQQLAQAEATLQNRLRKAAMDGGATLVAPETVFLNYDTILEKDVIVEPNVVFGSDVVVGEGSEIKSFSHLEGASIGARCRIGPYARLRPGTRLAEGVGIGNFVEVKNTEMGESAKANHLTYLGDSTVGARANIGAGTITCNYDGVHKHETRIGEEAFIGSNTALVAPVTVGDRAIIGAGSTITRDVGADELGLTRVDMKTVTSGADKVKSKKSKKSKKS
jgi:bifunctional UDP-N-acetylglucosamine pyrophosphorylase/glucosamine-1-phosphate N-acetyltransferase